MDRIFLAQRIWGAILGLACSFAASPVFGQYSLIQTPFNSASHSYYENIGVAWGLQGRGWFFNFGGPGPGAPPAFGGFDPNAQANLGFGFLGNGVSGRFSLTAGQGSDTTIASATPSVMVPNGGMGFFSDVSQRPFVLGVIPVVGEPVSPLKWRLQRMAEQGASPGPGTSAVPDGDKAAGTLGLSSAERGDLSVAAIRAGQAADEDAKSAEIASLLEKARSLEDAGKPGVAKIYYKRAALRATGEQQQEIAGKIRELDKK